MAVDSLDGDVLLTLRSHESSISVLLDVRRLPDSVSVDIHDASQDAVPSSVAMLLSPLFCLDRVCLDGSTSLLFCANPFRHTSTVGSFIR